MISFYVQGTVAAQGSKRHVGNGRMVETSKKLPAWRQAVIDAARATYNGPHLDEPIRLTVVFYIPRPNKPKFLDHPATPADLDKLIRAVGDALTISGIIYDDARIVEISARKIWATPRNPQGAHITIERMQP